MNQTVIIHQGRNKIWVGIDQMMNHTQRGMRRSSVEQTGNEDITCSLVQEVGLGGDEEKKLVVSLGVAVGVAESVDNAANVKRIETVPAKANVTKKVKSRIDVPVNGAELVNVLGPVGLIGWGLIDVVMVFKADIEVVWEVGLALEGECGEERMGCCESYGV